MIGQAGGESERFATSIYNHIADLISNVAQNAGQVVPADIKAIAFIVLMQATKSMNEDPKEIMTQVKGLQVDPQNSIFMLDNILRKISAGIELPDLKPDNAADTEIVSDNIRARSAIESARLLEDLKITPSENSDSEDDSDREALRYRH